MITMMVNNPLAEVVDLTSLRVLSCGGSPQSKAIVTRAIALFGCEFFLSYGMTECCGKISMSILPKDTSSLTPAEQLDLVCTSGRPFCMIHAKIVGEHGQEVPRDGKTVGEVLISGPTVFRGYTELPEANKEAFDDGWFRTGDLAVARSDGYLSVVDRKKDMLLVGGENVYTTEVEDVLHSHPAVHQAAVFGIPNKVMGELVMAAVILKKGYGNAGLGKEIVAFCRARLAEYKVPVAVHILESFPVTGSGKIMKTELRKMFSGDQKEAGIKQAEPEVVTPSNLKEMADYISSLAGGTLEVQDAGSDLSEISWRVIRGATYLFVTRSIASSMSLLSEMAKTEISDIAVMALERSNKSETEALSAVFKGKMVVVNYLPSSLFECRNDRLVRTALSAARSVLPPFAAILYDGTTDHKEDKSSKSVVDVRQITLDALKIVLDEDAVASIGKGEPFMASGVNSTLAVQVVSALEDALCVTIPGTAIFDYPTLDDMVAFLEEESRIQVEDTLESRASKQTQVRQRNVVASKRTGVSAMQADKGLESMVADIIAEAIGASQPDMNAPLMSLGVNSTIAVQLVSNLEALAGQDLPGTLIFDYPTIHEIADYIKSLRSSAILEDNSSMFLQPLIDHAELCAISTISGVVPGGDLEYTSVHGNDRITQVPLERWDVDIPPSDNERELNLQFGSFLKDVDLFDSRLFNISPAESLLIDPQQRLLMTEFVESWTDHSQRNEFTRDTGIFVGVSQLDYARIAYETGSALNTYYATGSHLSVTSGRISYSFGFKGPAMTVDTACSSSLVSTHLAARAIKELSCDVAGTLGVNLALVHSWTRACLRAGMLADDGRCKTLDASAGALIFDSTVLRKCVYF